MLLIPNGTFWMGCTISSDMTDCPGEETPNHWVTLTQPFYLGRYEVTQAQWKARTGYNLSHFDGVGYPDAPSHPVENISWDRIVGDFQPGTGLRLPTEAEWEWAYRAGTTQAYHGWAAMPEGFTDVGLLANIAWYDTNANSQTQPVGLLQPNGFGLYDMSGNVVEWCADGYDSNYYSDSPSVDPPGGTPGFLNTYVMRGGSWHNSASNSRASRRWNYSASNGSYSIGFRVARTP
jgi:formylglycine-generating enzyme required for sulfatase activity